MQNDVTHQDLLARLDANGHMLQRIHQELMHHKQMIEGAFPIDERGRPDYGGHKRQHLDIIESDKTLGEYKKAVTLRLLQGGIGLILTLVGLGIGQYILNLLGGIS